jgi:acyl carrier protein
VSEVDVQVRSAIESILARKVTDYSPELRLLEDLTLDSTSLIELLMAIEDKLGIEIEAEELTPEVFSTVATLTAYVEEALSNRSSV